MSFAERLLASALEYREAEARRAALPDAFSSLDEVRAEMEGVLRHEAREAMQAPLDAVPDTLYLHTVDMDGEEPGIVCEKQGGQVLRRPAQQLRKAKAEARAEASAEASRGFDRSGVFAVSEVDALRRAEKELASHVKRTESAAAAAEKRERKRDETKRERQSEGAEERAERLAKEREKRAERKKKREAEGGQAKPKAKKAAAVPADVDDDELAVRDESRAAGCAPRKRRTKLSVFANAVPHYRHIEAMRLCDPHPNLRPALCEGAASAHLSLIDGPPGTGKTRELVGRLAEMDGRRVLLCAPTNVGAANLYSRCVSEGWGEECSLALPALRVPAGCAVLSNDPSRRIVCATISSRSGPRLDAERFDAVLVDEAAQCMEAWIWTLLRCDVEDLVCAGDVRQLPAVVSESGGELLHSRSLMERLLSLGYSSVTRLTVQNRMAPELLSFPNSAFYEGRLQTGAHAPEEGQVVCLRVGGEEKRSGHSFSNATEAQAAVEEARRHEGSVLISPYLAQCDLLSSLRPERQVHTVDSFQGREADTVILSVVRDGTAGLGFWEDGRRLAVALTRARVRLVVVCSPAAWPSASLLARYVAELGEA